MRRLRLTLVSLLALLTVAAAYAAAQDPDRGFGRNGVSVRGFAAEQARARITTMAMDSSGAVFGAGYAEDGTAIGKYRRDGSLDPDWGAGGFTFEERLGVGAIGLQGNRLLVAGGLAVGKDFYDSAFAVKRLNPDGTLDRSFGDGDGIAVTELTDRGDFATGLAVDPQGRIVLMSALPVFDTQGYQLVRYTPGGRIDRSFGGGDGIVILEVPGYVPCCTGPTPIHAGASITFGGVWSGEPVVYRLRESGDLDTDFGGGDGIATFSAQLGRVVDLDLSPDGSIVTAHGYGMRAARLHPDGTPDESFGTGGASEPVPPDPVTTQARSIAALADGSVLLGGTTYPGGGAIPGDFALLHLLPNGIPDPAFGPGGLVNIDISGNSYDEAHAMEVADDGRAVIAGETVPERFFPVFALASYEAGGDPDPAFGGGDGITFGPALIPGGDEFEDVAVDRRHRILAAARGGGRLTVARFLPGGDPDPSFGVGGFFRWPGTKYAYDWAAAVAVRPDAVYVAGRASGGGAVVKLDLRGSPAMGFGDGGLFVSDFLGAATDVRSLPYGEVLVAGYRGSRAYAIRLEADGELDLTFGDAGVAEGHITPGAQKPAALLAPRAQGGFLLVRGGQVSAFDAEGDPDREYGAGGSADLHIYGRVGILAAALTKGGRMLMAGVSEKRMTVVRLTPGGKIDRSFGRNGMVTREVGVYSQATGVRGLRNGSLVVSGVRRLCSETEFCRPKRGFLAAFGPRGRPWRAFGRRSLVFARSGAESGLSALVAQRRAIVAAGWAGFPGRRKDLLLTRYRLDRPR